MLLKVYIINQEDLLELEKDVGSITRYKIQIKAGFGGNCEDEVKELIDKSLEEII